MEHPKTSMVLIIKYFFAALYVIFILKMELMINDFIFSILHLVFWYIVRSDS